MGGYANRPGSRDTPVAISLLSTQILVSLKLVQLPGTRAPCGNGSVWGWGRESRT